METQFKRTYQSNTSTQASGLALRLRQERERLRLSQRVFGHIGGVEANAQSKYESGQRIPKADYLAALAAIGVDVVFVITGLRSPVDDISLDEQKMMTNFRSLQREDQDAISRVTVSIAFYSGRYL
jgi:transcriptional regulator with XRE-family HTH domain